MNTLNTIRITLAFAMLFVSACATFIDGAKETRNMLGREVREAAASWEKDDQARLDQINRDEKFREDALKKIAEYKNSADRKEGILVFNGGWLAITTLDKAIVAYEAGKKGEIQKAIEAGHTAIGKIIVYLTKVGIKIPAGAQ